MAKEWAKPFYNSKAWQDCRDSFISHRVSIDGGMCQRCEAELGYIAHHKEWLTPSNINDPMVSLSHDNLEYVCHDCHNKEHFATADPVRDDVMFDSSGNLIKK